MLSNSENPLLIIGIRKIERGTCQPNNSKDKPASISIIKAIKNGENTIKLQCPKQSRNWFRTKCALSLNGGNCPQKFIIENFPPSSIKTNAKKNLELSTEKPKNGTLSAGDSYHLGLL